VKAGITTRTHPHRFRTTCITHLFNNKINPEIIRKHARHSKLRQTFEYDRPTQTDEADALERVFVKKEKLDDDDRIKVTIDNYIKGEITNIELQTILDVLRPKQLKSDGELRGYQ
jgi:integrase